MGLRKDTEGNIPSTSSYLLHIPLDFLSFLWC